jgi:hypothetical protein
MALTIKHYNLELDTVGIVGSITFPFGTEVAFRVYDKYLPNQVPPPPSIGIVTAEDPTTISPVMITRNFILVPGADPLPDNYLKYVATLPFGPTKETVHLIEIS